MSKTGENPGEGSYLCISCWKEVVLADSADRLPPCPDCGGLEYVP